MELYRPSKKEAGGRNLIGCAVTHKRHSSLIATQSTLNLEKRKADICPSHSNYPSNRTIENLSAHENNSFSKKQTGSSTKVSSTTDYARNQRRKWIPSTTSSNTTRSSPTASWRPQRWLCQSQASSNESKQYSRRQ